MDLRQQTEQQSDHSLASEGKTPFEVNLDGFDGPIDLLLDLAKKQKLDIKEISILELANQYLSFIEQARALRIEVAADYLVMAAWLAYLKSRLLLPPEEVDEEELTSEQMADLLAFQLKRLEAMRQVGQALYQRPLLNDSVLTRGRGYGFHVKTQLEFDLKLHDLIHAYGKIQAQNQASFYQPKPRTIFKVEDAMKRLTTMLGLARDWMTMETFMPLEDIVDIVIKKSAVASTFGAFLELTKQGKMDIKQDALFAPIYARKAQEDVHP